MTLKELKDTLSLGTAPNDFMIFVCTKDRFLANQYIEELCRIKACDKVKIQSVFEPITSALSLVINFEDNLNVLDTETFDEVAEDYSQFINTVVICDKIDKKITSAVKDYVIEFPELKDWQIQDYIHKLCPNILHEDIVKLCALAHNDIYRVLNEIDKVTVFPKTEQPKVLLEILNDPSLDMCEDTQIFSLVDAVVLRDYQTIFKYMMHLDNFRVDPVGFVTLVLNRLKTVALITQACDLKQEELAELLKNPKQAYYIKRDFSSIPAERLFKQIEFLSNTDLRLKSSEFDLPIKRFFEYIVNQLLAC